MYFNKQMKKFKKMLRAVKKDNMKINIDPLNIMYTNIKHAFYKNTKNQKNNVPLSKKGTKGRLQNIKKRGQSHQNWPLG